MRKSKGKVFLALKHHAMKTCWRAGEQLHAFLISTLDGAYWSALRSGRSIPRDITPCTTG